jgi:hypothetical protein
VPAICGCDNHLIIRRDEVQARVLKALLDKPLATISSKGSATSSSAETNRLRMKRRDTRRGKKFGDGLTLIGRVDTVKAKSRKPTRHAFRFRTQGGDAPVPRPLHRKEDSTWRVTSYDLPRSSLQLTAEQRRQPPLGRA